MRACGDQQPRLPALGASPAASPHSDTPRSPDACGHHRCSGHALDPRRIYGGEDVGGWGFAPDGLGKTGGCPTPALFGFQVPVAGSFLPPPPPVSLFSALSPFSPPPSRRRPPPTPLF